MRNYRRLEVWASGHELALVVYRATAGFPREEIYGLSQQIRRAAVSIPANLAEGSGRGTDADFARFIHYAIGSANELEALLRIARDLRLLSSERSKTLANRLMKLHKQLRALLKRVAPDQLRP